APPLALPPRSTTLFTKPMPSVRVRPEPELFLAGRPKSSKSMGFDDQEPADQGPCDNEDQERHGLDRNRDAERMRHLVQHDRQHQDEGRAEEGAEDRAQAPDDDHE